MNKTILFIVLLVALVSFKANSQTITFSEKFFGGASYCPGDPQYDNWGAFRAQLDTNLLFFTSVTIKGDLDPIGLTCTDPIMVNQIAGSLRDGVMGDWACGPINFHVGISCSGGCAIPGDDVEFNASGTDCQCTDPGYVLRPCIGNGNWGGLNGPTCNAVNQIMEVEFAYVTFCTPTYTNACSTGDFIDGVAVSDLSNTTTGCNGNANNFIFYSSMVANVGVGSSYPITLTPSTSSPQGFGVWMDFNGDNDYADAGEFVLGVPAGIVPVTNNITIPMSAIAGNTRMRIRSIGGVTPVAGDSCNNQLNGETEDYVLTIKHLIDVGVVQIDSPAAACGLSAFENVVIQVYNFGADTLDTIPLAYSLNGGPAVIDTLFAILNPGATLSFSFSTPADFSVYGTHIIDAWSLAPSDGDISNDSSLGNAILNIPIINTLPYFQDFESGDGGWVAEGTNSSWEFGAPTNTFINAAASGSNAWVTNLTGNYNPNDSSYLISPCMDFSGLTYDPILRFSHIFSISDINDGGFVEFSLNGGVTWIKLGTSASQASNWYNDGFNDTWNETSGDTGVWRTALHELTSLAGQPDVKLRFVLNSNIFSEDEGFGIDDIIIWEPVPDDVGVVLLDKPFSGCALTVSENVTVKVENMGTASQDTIPVAYSINGGPAVIDTIFNLVLPGDTITFTFAVPADLSALIVHNVDVWTDLSADTFNFNDSILDVSVENFIGYYTFPFLYDIEIEPTCVTICGNPCPLTGLWENLSSDDIDWTVDMGGTGSANTGPAVDKTTGTATGKYLYTEASGCNNMEAILQSPCIDLDTMDSPTIDFAYHMFGGNMGVLNVEIDTGGNWVSLVTLSGQVQASDLDPWIIVSSDLSMYTGVVRLRFRGITGPGFTSDIAIDDIKVYDKPLIDVGVIEITAPGSCGDWGTNEVVTITVKNFGLNTQDTIPVAYTMNGGPMINDTVYATLSTGATASFSFAITQDMSAMGSYVFDAWTELLGDGDNLNDSLINYISLHQVICCIPTFQVDCSSNDYIDGVVFAGINNVGTGCNGNPDNYIYYANDTAIVTVGNSYNITLTPSTVFDQGFGVWIDYNRDGDFDDLNEFVFSSASTTTPVSGSITIPGTALMGNSIIRVRCLYASTLVASNNCDNQTFGETEDYNISISPAAAIDAGITIISSPNSNCDLQVNELVTVDIQNFGSDTIFGLDVYYSLNNGTPVMETLTDTIPPSMWLTYTFLINADLSIPGTYSFKVWTDLLNDAINTNDTLFNYQVTHEPVITTYPFIEDFETLALCGTLCGSICNTTGAWTNGKDDDIDWATNAGGTPSFNTGPTVDNTYGTSFGNYLYTEASGCSFTEAHLLSPCIDNSLMANAALEFAYHMHGSQMGNIFVDIFYGGTWITIDSIMGEHQPNQTDLWKFADVNLGLYPGVVKLRIRGITGFGFESDMAIDDIRVYDKPANDVGVVAIVGPIDGCLTATEQVTVRVKNFGALAQDTIPVAYRINGGPSVVDTIYANINPSDTLTYSFIDLADFSISGIYNVDSWTFLNSDGNTTNDSIIADSVENTKTLADFTVDYTLNCKGGVCTFTDLATNGPSSWLWDFGDGNTSTLQNPTHIYVDTGSFTVTLTVTNPCNTDVAVFIDYMSIAQGPKLPVCIPTITDMNNNVGIYNFTFNTFNNTTGSLMEGYQDYSCFYFTTVLIGSKHTLSVETGQFWNENVRIWIDFNNDSIFDETTELVMSSDDKLQFHSIDYIFPQNVVTDTMLRMRVSSDYTGGPAPLSCSNIAFGQSEDYGVFFETSTNKPEADYNYISIDPCSGIIQFTDFSSFFPDSLYWDFGDGNTAVGDSVTNTYSPGTYLVTLIATNIYGSDTTTQTVFVDSIYAQFSIPSDSVNPGNVVSYTNTSYGGNSWSWDFGDSSTSGIQNPLHAYDSVGTYTIWLWVLNTSTGCMDSTNQQIVVFLPPPPDTSVGIGQILEDVLIDIHPIPSTGIFNVEFVSGNKKDIQIAVCDVTGKVLYEKEILVRKEHTEKIDLSQKSKGVYFVKISSINGLLQVRKVILK